jgi:hypothetical protein
MKRNWLFFVVILVFVAVLTLSHSPLHIAGVATDQGIYQYVARVILDGGLPYRDAWDHKQPLTYMIYALGLLITNNSFWGIWVVELFLLALTGLSSFILLRKLTSPTIALLIVLNSILSIWVLSGYANPEQLALPFYMNSLVLFFSLMATKKNSKNGNYSAILIGGLIAGGFFLKQSLISVGASIVILLIIDILINRRWSEVKNLLYIGLGFFIVTIVFITYLGLNHDLTDYWNAAYQFNFMYSQTGLLEKLLSIVDELESISTFPGLFVVIPLWITVLVFSLLMQMPRIVRLIQRKNFQFISALLGSLVLIAIIGKAILDGALDLGVLKITGLALSFVLFLASIFLTQNSKLTLWLKNASGSQLILQLHSQPRGVRTLIYLGVILVPATFFLNSLSGEHYDYYKITFYPSLIILQGVILHLFLSSTKEIIVRNMTLLIAAGFWFGSSISPVVSLINQYQSKPDAEFLKGVEVIKQSTNQEDPIYVWGTDTSLYVMTERKSPTRYFYQLAAVAWEPYEKRFGVVNEIVSSLTANKPKLIVLPAALNLRGNLPECLDSADNYGNESPVFEFVCRNYQYTGSYSDFQIYSLRAPN